MLRLRLRTIENGSATRVLDEGQLPDASPCACSPRKRGMKGTAMTDMTATLLKAKAQMESARAQRDQAILDAVAAGMKKTAIAEAVGLSRMHVHRILNNK